MMHISFAKGRPFSTNSSDSLLAESEMEPESRSRQICYLGLPILNAMKSPLGIIRTPEYCFNGLKDYPFEPCYQNVDANLRMHYIDVGNKDHPLVLLLHGEPSWSYLFRCVIPKLVANDFRVIAPDLIGFGKSDKPLDRSAYTYESHTRWLQTFIEALRLSDINLFCHDWGGMIALRIVASYPSLFSKVIASYAFLHNGSERIPDNFLKWQHFSQTESDFLAGEIVAMGSYTPLSADIKNAYNAPFPEEKFKAGARQFPLMIPSDKDDPVAKTNAVLRDKLKTYSKPFLTVWGDHDDPMWHGKDKVLQHDIPGASGQDHKVLHANHFLLEDQPDETADIMIKFFKN